MTTDATQFEDERASRSDRMYDAVTLLDRLAKFFREDGYTEDDWNDRCGESWDSATEDAA